MSKIISPDRDDLVKSLGKSTIYGFISNFAQAASRLVSVPVVIHYLGLEGYGIWNIVMMTAMYMRFGSVGVKTAFQKYVAEATGSGDFPKANTLLTTGFSLMIVVSFVVGVPAAIFSRQIALASGIPASYLSDTSISIAVLALIFSLSNIGSVFEAMIMGVHRTDLVRKASTVLTIAEAAAIVFLLRAGYGLIAMAWVMGMSEILYIAYCMVASREVAPQIRLSSASFRSSAIPELFRFAGSYQCVNLLEVLYGSILPVAIMRIHGPQVAGMFAVVHRVFTMAKMFQEPIMAPVLSGAAMIYATGSVANMNSFIAKSFKAILALSLIPFAFAAVFGEKIAYAWTGEAIGAGPQAFWLVALASQFGSLSLLALVLYRSSGNGVMDNVRQVFRLLSLLGLILYAKHLGLAGILASMAIAEFGGFLLMLFALDRTFHFPLGVLAADAARISVTAALGVLGGLVVFRIPLPSFDISQRFLAAFQLGLVGLGGLSIMLPVAIYTGSITVEERNTLLAFFGIKQKRSVTPTEQLATD